MLSFLQNKRKGKKEDKKPEEDKKAEEGKKELPKIESIGPTMDYSKYKTQVKTILSDKGLESWQKKESKQRVEMFMLLDDEGKGLISYKQFWQLLKYSDVYLKLADHTLNKTELNVNGISTRKHMLNEYLTNKELNALGDLENRLEQRTCNFKEFMIFMRFEEIFKKFVIESNDGISYPELVLAFKQMNLPMLGEIVKRGQNSLEF